MNGFTVDEKTPCPSPAEVEAMELRAMRRERNLRNLTILLALVVILCSVVVVVQYRQNRIARANNMVILNQINDCTKPGGECYEAGARTRVLLENENKQVTEHRDRNEELHSDICKRQDEIAEALGFRFKTECPPRLTPHTDSLPEGTP